MSGITSLVLLAAIMETGTAPQGADPATGQLSEDTAAPAPPPMDEGEVPFPVQQIARESQALPLGQRMVAVSEAFMGLPYVIDPAGEGRPPDLDPPARYDAFDCLTFVEEVLALTLSGDPSGAAKVRHSLRYGDDQPAVYRNRRHFMLEEWIPRNIAAGWLEDITDQVGAAHLLRKHVDAGTWSRWRKRRLFALSDDRLPVGDYELNVLSLGAAAEAIDRIPDGAILLTVRRDRDDEPIVVTHLGFKIAGAEPLMRHATKMGEQPRVRNERLHWYLEHVRWYARWEIEGITVLMPREQGPRMSKLAQVSP